MKKVYTQPILTALKMDISLLVEVSRVRVNKNKGNSFDAKRASYYFEEEYEEE